MDTLEKVTLVWVILCIGMVIGWRAYALIAANTSDPDTHYTQGYRDGQANARKTLTEEFTAGIWRMIEDDEPPESSDAYVEKYDSDNRPLTAETWGAMIADFDGKTCAACGRGETDGDKFITVNGDLIHYSHRTNPESGYYRGY